MSRIRTRFYLCHNSIFEQELSAIRTQRFYKQQNIVIKQTCTRPVSTEVVPSKFTRLLSLFPDVIRCGVLRRASLTSFCASVMYADELLTSQLGAFIAAGFHVDFHVGADDFLGTLQASSARSVI